jgi:hypothetical protein
MEAGMMSAFRREDMRTPIASNVDHVPIRQIPVDLVWILPILKCLAGRAIPLLVAFPTMFGALCHGHCSTAE